MEITEVRIKLMDDPGDRLKAFCSITFDNCFVVRDLKIIEGANGPFVAMPSRKLTAHCPKCRTKNHLRAQYCNQCGKRLDPPPAPKDADGRLKLYADIAHPINSACREMIQKKVLAAFEEEKARSKLPGYVPSYSDFDEAEYEDYIPPSRPSAAEAPAPPAPPAPPTQGPEKPHGPHTPPAKQPQGQPGSSQQDGFGAGVFQ
jgi:stage V sporulation protein G